MPSQERTVIIKVTETGDTEELQEQKEGPGSEQGSATGDLCPVQPPWDLYTARTGTQQSVGTPVLLRGDPENCCPAPEMPMGQQRCRAIPGGQSCRHSCKGRSGKGGPTFQSLAHLSSLWVATRRLSIRAAVTTVRLSKARALWEAWRVCSSCSLYTGQPGRMYQ